MKRARILGVAAVMALALTAVAGASSASASGFIGQSYPSYFKGAGIGTHSFTTIMGESNCQPGTLTESANSGFETFAADLSGTKCQSNAFNMNGCKFILHPGAANGAGTFDIGPAGCGPITTTITGCEMKISAQNGLAANFQNGGSGSTATVTVTASATGLKYSTASGCPGGAATYTDGKYSGTWELKNYTNAAYTSQQGVRVAYTPTGLFSGGGAVEAESYPAAIVGSQLSSAKPFKFTTSAGTTKCTGVQLHNESAAATGEVALDVENTGCLAFGMTASLEMKSCKYVLVAGGISLVCSKLGDGLVINTSGCTVTIPPQSLGSVTYENIGKGISRYVSATASGTGISYTTTGGACGASGSNGTFGGPFELKGFLAAF